MSLMQINYGDNCELDGGHHWKTVGTFVTLVYITCLTIALVAV
jgi:hypothetical protein